MLGGWDVFLTSRGLDVFSTNRGLPLIALLSALISVDLGAFSSAQVSPLILRNQAQTVVMPRFPPTSLAQGQTGRVVVVLQVSETGKVADLKILESTYPAMGKEVDFALRRWSFMTIKLQGKPVPFQGRLIFYFGIINGKPVVVDAVNQELALTKKKRL
jgi:TonB family protein